MKSTMLEISGHLSDETIQLLKKGRLSQAESMEALAHIGECAICADCFARCYDESELLEVSPDFTQRTLKTAGNLPADRAPAQSAMGMRAFHAYALRVAAAVCLTLTLLFASPFQAAVNAIESKDIGRLNEIGISKVDAFNDSIWDITDKIVKLEVYKNDQEKK